jgi:hypothetical protein
MSVDSSAWTGEGEFTKTLLEVLSGLESIEFLRVEDAPSSRAESGYCFISNEIYVGFRTRARRERIRRLFVPMTRLVREKAMSLADLESALTLDERVGPPDYVDEGMLQYLRTERIVAPYQTKGYKLVEMVRIYEANATV